MVGKSREEGLIHSSTLEIFRDLLASEHVVERVLVAFGPELINQLDVVLQVEWPGDC